MENSAEQLNSCSSKRRNFKQWLTLQHFFFQGSWNYFQHKQRGLLQCNWLRNYFQDFEKVQYTNDITYKLTPISMVDENFELSDLSGSSPENVGKKEIIFKKSR